MDKSLVELYEDYLKFVDQKDELLKQIKRLKQSQENEINMIKQKYNKQIAEVNNSINQLENDEYNIISNYLKQFDEYKNFKFEEFYFNLSPNLMLGQKINTLDYFKKLLEEKTGKKLIIVKHITNYKKKDKEYYDYECYDVEKTMIDTMFIPEDKQNQLFKSFSKLNLQQYEKVITKLPYVFLLKRKWYECELDNSMQEVKEDEKYFHITLNYFNGDKRVFNQSIYNKDLEYDKIVLKTYEYYLQSKKLEQHLLKQKDLKKRIKENEQLKKQLQKEQKCIQNSKKQLQTFTQGNELCK